MTHNEEVEIAHCGVAVEAALVMRGLMEAAEHHLTCPVYRFPTQTEDHECNCGLTNLLERAGVLSEQLAAMSVGRDMKLEMLTLKAQVMAETLESIWEAMENASSRIEKATGGTDATGA